MLGLIYLGIAILGYITHKKLVNFSTSALAFVYALSFSPLYILLYVYLKLKKEFGDYIDVGAYFTENASVMGIIIVTLILCMVNIIYFQSRKDEFQYY